MKGRHQTKRERGAKRASLKRRSVWRREGERCGSRIDVWRRRFPNPTDARPSCRAFFYAATATPSIHSCWPHASSAIIAAYATRRKVLRFVLSSRKAENRSCFRVRIAPQFVLSSRNRPSNSCFRVEIGPACESRTEAGAGVGQGDRGKGRTACQTHPTLSPAHPDCRHPDPQPPAARAG
jgi:hypothetical protein